MRIIGADARRSEYRDALLDRCEGIEPFDELTRDPQNAPGVGAREVASFVAPLVQELLVLGDGRAPVADGLVDEDLGGARPSARSLLRRRPTSCRQVTLLRALAKPLARFRLRFRGGSGIRLLPGRRSQRTPRFLRARRLWSFRAFSGHAYDRRPGETTTGAER